MTSIINYLGIEMLIGSIISIVLYSLQAIGLYSIAKQRGISCPWLAWLPIGNNWIIGAISDNYQEKANGKTKHKRLLLAALTVIIICLSISVFLDFFTMATDETALTSDVLKLFATIGIVCILMVVYDVLLYIALYHVFKSCDPSTAAMFLLLSIFVGGSSSIWLFIQRNKYNGVHNAFTGFN